LHKTRLEAFSDAVIAIIITIMVLELRPPETHDWHGLWEMHAIWLSYVLSFVYLAIYWNNHHHLLQACERVNGNILWANMHLLFWLSVVPFVTAFMGESHFAAFPVALYGVVQLMAACAYYILTLTLLAHHGRDSRLAAALGSDFKGKISVVMYVVAVASTFVSPWIACAIYALVVIMWLVPDRRMERALAPHG
jgi:uncharacterized membrane protein